MTAKELFQNIIPHKQMQFTPVQEDDDEISQAIANDPIDHDNQWQLADSLDGEKLGEFWDAAVKELGVLQPEDEENS